MTKHEVHLTEKTNKKHKLCDENMNFHSGTFYLKKM